MRRSALLAGLVLATGVLLISLSGCSKADRKSGHLKRADAFFASGDREKARIEYLNVVKLDPTNRPALSRLAEIHFDRGELGPAVPLLLRARELAPEDPAVRRRLGQLYVESGRSVEARAEAEAILRQDPDDADAILILSRAARTTNEIAQARTRLEAIRSQLGDRAAIHVALGNLAIKSGDGAGAENEFKRGLALDPKSSRARLALGNLYWVQGKTNEAGALFEEAAHGADPASPERLRWAQHQVQTGAPTKAKELLETAVKADPENTSVVTLLGELALAQSNFIECSNRVARVLRQDPTHYDALVLKARLLRAQRDTAGAVEVLLRAQALYPDNAQLAYESGVAYLANRNLAEAINRVQSALAIDPQYPEANLLLADLLLARGDAQASVRVLQKFAQDRPEILRTHLSLATAYQAQGRYEEALTAVNRYLQTATNDAAGLVTKGLILRQTGRNLEARAAFERADLLAPRTEAVLYQLVELDLLDKRYDDAMRRVQAAIQQSPGSPGPAYLLARVHLAQNQMAEAEAALNKTIELAPNYSLAYTLLLDIYARRGDYAAALQKLEAFLAQRPGNVGALMVKGMIHDRQGDVAQAREAYSTILATNANVVPALNNLAYLYSEHLNDLDTARRLAARARELAPDDAGVADTLGWIEYRRGAPDAALRLLQESAARQPNDAEVQYHLGMARYLAGQTEPARQALARAIELSTNFPGWTNAQHHLALLSAGTQQSPDALITVFEKQVAEHPNDPAAWQRLGTLHAERQAVEKAKAAFEQVLRINPKSAAANLGLAQLYSGPLRDPVTALKLAKEARRLAPTDNRMVLALGRIAFQSGDYAWADSLLSEAVRIQPGDTTVLFDYAQAAYSQGRVGDARQAMERYLRAEPQSSNASAARQFLELTAVSEKPAAAISLLPVAEKTLNDNPASVPALVVSAIALEAGGHAAESRQTYDQIMQVFPAFSPAMARLAVLLTEAGTDDQRAYSLATKSREIYPKDAELARALAKLSQRRGDHRYAAQLLEQVTRDRPTDAEAFYLLGLSQQQLGQTAACRAALAKALELAPEAAFAAQARATLASLN